MTGGAVCLGLPGLAGGSAENPLIEKAKGRAVYIGIGTVVLIVLIVLVIWMLRR